MVSYALLSIISSPLGKLFTSIPTPQTVVVPIYYLAAGFVHPPKDTKSVKLGLLS